VAGDTVTKIGTVTVTCAEADFEGSATEVAVTVTEMELPEMLEGAVYNPLALTVPPPLADQVTLVLEVPVTVAVNCCVTPASKVTLAGDTLTEITGTVIVICAEPDFERSAFDIAVTVTVV
jgi:hypothetical protein